MERIDDSIIRRGDCEYCYSPKVKLLGKSVCRFMRNSFDMKVPTECEKAMLRRAVTGFIIKKGEE